MPRPAGSTLEHSIALKLYIFELHDAGLKQVEIACRVGRSQQYVSQVLRAGRPVTTSVTVLKQALELRRSHEGSHMGPRTLLYEMYRLGYSENCMPSHRTLSRWIRDHGLASMTVGGRGDKRRYHNYFLDEYGSYAGLTASCQRFMVDFYGPLTIADVDCYVLVVTDKFSHMTYGEIGLKQYGSWLKGALGRAFDVLGIPEEVQSDNGFGLRLAGRTSLGQLIGVSFQRGVRRVHFIPDAQPNRNNSVERWNRTQYTEFWSKYQQYDGTFSWSSLAACQSDFAVYLHYYNTARQHQSLPCRPDSQFHFTPADIHIVAVSCGPDPRGGCVSFTRLMSRWGVSSVHTGVIVQLAEYKNRYVTWEFYQDGSGQCLHAGALVATFMHELGRSGGNGCDVVSAQAVIPAVDMAYPVDARVYARKLQKELRRPKPVAAFLPAGFRLICPDGDWEIIEEATGELVASWRDSRADHILEEFVFANINMPDVEANINMPDVGS